MRRTCTKSSRRGSSAQGFRPSSGWGRTRSRGTITCWPSCPRGPLGPPPRRLTCGRETSRHTLACTPSDPCTCPSPSTSSLSASKGRETWKSSSRRTSCASGSATWTTCSSTPAWTLTARGSARGSPRCARLFTTTSHATWWGSGTVWPRRSRGRSGSTRAPRTQRRRRPPAGRLTRQSLMTSWTASWRSSGCTTSTTSW
mmetsp:Transcript_35548/g.112153  ORF Transcript_35548/g.112153 Transcript_35548/m.112153 type:complete len:200 (-) Transcript_35548:329-928(-)